MHTIIRYVRDREWVAVIAAVTTAVTWAEGELDWLATVIDPVPGDNPAQLVVVILGAWITRGGVTSNATRTAGLTE